MLRVMLIRWRLCRWLVKVGWCRSTAAVHLSRTVWSAVIIKPVTKR